MRRSKPYIDDAPEPEVKACIESLRQFGTVCVRKEAGQAGCTFLPENAAAMLSCVPDGRRMWHINPLVRRAMYMWGTNCLNSPFEPHAIAGICRAYLFGIPIEWDETLPDLGTEGDVVLSCTLGRVVLQTRD